MLRLQYTTAITTILFIFQSILLLNGEKGLAFGYVSDLALTSKRYYEATSPKELSPKEATVQYKSKLGYTEAITEFSTGLPRKLVTEANTDFQNYLQKKVGMLIRITPRMIKYCARELKLIFQKELENEQLPGFSRILMKLNVSVLTPRIHSIAIPRFTYKVTSNNTVEVIQRGGSARLLSSYRAVYRTVREGQLEANMSSFAISLKFKITTTFAGKLLFEDLVCGAEVHSIDIKLTPKLHELVDEGLRDELDEITSIVICETMEAYMSKFEERLNKLIRSPLCDVKINNKVERLLIDTTISNGILLSEDNFDFPLLGTPTVSKTENGLLPLMKLPSDKVKMVYVYVSEFVVNTFLKQLDTFGDMTVQLNEEPEFQKLLSLNCSENTDCMGDFLEDTEPYQPNSGHIIIKLRSSPIASIREGMALIDLHLIASVSYRREDLYVKVLEFEWLVTVRMSNEFLNERLAQSAVRKTNVSLNLVEMAVSNVTPYVDMIPNFDEHLLRLIILRKKSLEKVLTQQCALIRVTPSALYKSESRTGAFRNRTLVIATGIEWTAELLQHFSLFS